MWHTSAVATVSGSLLAYCAFGPAYNMLQEPGEVLLKCPEVFTTAGTGIAVGHLLFDSMSMILSAEEYIASKLWHHTYAYQMIVHHVLSVVFWLVAILKCRCAYYVNYCLLTEITLPFIQLRWMLKQLALDDTHVYIANGLVLVLLWFLVRIVTIPYVFYVYFQADYSAFDWIEFSIAMVSLPIPPLLNIVWFNTLVRGALNVLQGNSHLTD